MSHKLRLNLILMVVIGLLAVLVWQSQPESMAPLSQLAPAEIRNITILSGTNSLTMRLEQDQWLIDDRPGLTSRIEQLLTISQTASLKQFPAPPDLTPFGLDNPGIVLLLDQARFSFGDIDPLNGWRYVLYNGVIHLIGNGYHHHLTAPLEAWLAQPDA
ncbi:MAG: DUF4340 domain-containing protein [Candidatus Thiodiazotropha weberae]|nr:DUF4340 domain-containing protein [Candidatus Thiodiazotropha lotti]MCG8020850.1 DUF4340 domain-containing protein [Candidatus Thiodiazotropha lotti]MCW4208015.1 DUF4340 domain-containing protein [Candidatus Thiodiazotropha lotti]MCW4215753.1 DUF4340 domain-containing protein [Candidatus Thiodiazotropha lotti]